jgi:hypothetical protein
MFRRWAWLRIASRPANGRLLGAARKSDLARWTRIVDEEMTAGKIAKYFIDLTRNMPRSREREELSNAAKIFAGLVVDRNRILHGKPCTGPNGESRLSSTSVIEIPDLEDAADSFVACGSELNRLSYGFLSAYVPQ